MGRPSLIHQVEVALQTLFTPGESRYAQKTAGDAAECIPGIDTMKAYVECGCRFVKWCQQEYDGIRYLRDIRPPMVQAYVLQLCDRELSGGYLGKVVAALRKLDVALRVKGWRDPDASLWLPEGGGWHSDAHPERAYTPEQARQLLVALTEARDPQVPMVAQLQIVAGLRIAEASMLRGEDIDVEHGQLHLVKATKGGRARTVTVAAKHRDFLQVLKTRAARHWDGHVFQGRGERGRALSRRVRAAVTAAAKRVGVPDCGTHGFRKLYAQQRYAEALDAGQSDRAAREAVSQELGHNRVAVTYSYVPR